MAGTKVSGKNVTFGGEKKDDPDLKVETEILKKVVARKGREVASHLINSTKHANKNNIIQQMSSAMGGLVGDKGKPKPKSKFKARGQVKRPDIVSSDDDDYHITKEAKQKKLSMVKQKELDDFKEKGGFMAVLQQIFVPTDPSSIHLDAVF